MASGSTFKGVSLLEFRYLELCRRRELSPNSSVLSELSKAKVQEMRKELCVFNVALDQFTRSGISALNDALSSTFLSGIDVVDVHQESSNVCLDEECVISLLQTVNEKLRMMDIRDWGFWKGFLRRGVACHILNLRFTPIVKLNLCGNFLQLQTLNLDFCVSLSSFRISCLSCMPNLMRLSMCETRIANLWMACAALSKLPSLVELRFQNCLCCFSTGACTSLFGNNVPPAPEKIPPGHNDYSYFQPLSVIKESSVHRNMQNSFSETPTQGISDNVPLINQESPGSIKSDTLDSELNFTTYQQDPGSWAEVSTDATLGFFGHANMEITTNQSGHLYERSSDSPGAYLRTIQFTYPEIDSTSNQSESYSTPTIEDAIWDNRNTFPFADEYHGLNLVNQGLSYSVLRASQQCSIDLPGPNTLASHVASTKYVSHHPSPICFERHYREYMIVSLPQLKVLDNLLISDIEREKANTIIRQHFELLPYCRPSGESITTILHNREVGSCKLSNRNSHSKLSYNSRENNHFFTRSLSSAKTGSSQRPHMHSLSQFKSTLRCQTKNFRPRQFEYHPTNPALMVFGTLDGELIVLNHESGRPVGYIPSSGAFNSILGLCWLKNHPSKLIAGSDNGSLKLYDLSRMSSQFSDRYQGGEAAACSYDEFEHLTSVHINSTDELFLASGFTKHVALYDISTGRRVQVFRDLHLEHINVVKFANHSPSLFATASFDQDVKMWDLRQGISRPCYTVSSTRGNVMVCFSPDDHYLLSSAVDNEVRQHLAVDGRLHMAFDISSSGSVQNYTRSYYMNGRDYIISGSSEENVIRVCCSQTGRRLRDIFMESKGLKNSMFVQSLRGDPFRETKTSKSSPESYLQRNIAGVFHFSVLATYFRSSSKSEIIRVNMLASGDSDVDENLCVQHWCPLHMGG